MFNLDNDWKDILNDVKKLKEAFIENEDIHTKTAKEVFGHSDITSEERRRAKAVNFGIVYGISAFGLANDIGVSNAVASDYIKKYYQAYPEIKVFMDDTVEFCKETGYVRTLKNRIRYIPDINSNIYMQDENWKKSPYLRIMYILDYISSMTDSAAVKLHKKLKGINVSLLF